MSTTGDADPTETSGRVDALRAIHKPRDLDHTHVNLSESDEEVLDVLRDLRRHGVYMLTVGQYLSPRAGNPPVERYVAPAQFDALAQAGARHGLCPHRLWATGAIEQSR